MALKKTYSDIANDFSFSRVDNIQSKEQTFSDNTDAIILPSEEKKVETVEKKSEAGRKRTYISDNSEINENKGEYFRSLIRFPKELEVKLKILVIQEGYKGGITEYVNKLVLDDCKKKGLI